jgi:hypothetical protein
MMKPFYIFNEDELRVGVKTATAGLVIQVAGVMLNANGEQSNFSVVVAPTSDRVETVTQNNIGSGWILHCAASLVSGTLTPRCAYVRADIVRPMGSGNTVQTELLSGYLENTFLPSFPFVRPSPPLDGVGASKVIIGNDPAAGAEVNDTVPAGAAWRLRAALLTLVTSANVANRRPHLVFDDGTNVYLRSVSGTDIPASTTATISFWAGGTIVAPNNNVQVAPLPDAVLLFPGHRIRTITTALDAGDNYGAPVYMVEEYLV